MSSIVNIALVLESGPAGGVISPARTSVGKANIRLSNSSVGLPFLIGVKTFIGFSIPSKHPGYEG